MLTAVGWIVIKSLSHIKAPLRINGNNFNDPLTFHFLPPSGHNPNLGWTNTMTTNDIPIPNLCQLLISKC